MPRLVFCVICSALVAVVVHAAPEYVPGALLLIAVFVGYGLRGSFAVRAVVGLIVGSLAVTPAAFRFQQKNAADFAVKRALSEQRQAEARAQEEARRREQDAENTRRSEAAAKAAADEYLKNTKAYSEAVARAEKAVRDYAKNSAPLNRTFVEDAEKLLQPLVQSSVAKRPDVIALRTRLDAAKNNLAMIVAGRAYEYKRREELAASRADSAYLIVTVEKTEYEYGYFKTTGVVENAGGKPAFSPEVVLEVLSDSGDVLLAKDSAYPSGALFANLEPGRKAAFEHITSVPGQPRRVRWQVSIKNHPGEVITPR